MFTTDSFCKSILEMNYANWLCNIPKDGYKSFEIPKKGGIRIINYLDKSSTLWSLQDKLLHNFLTKQDLPICVKGFQKGESYLSFLNEHVGATYFLRTDISSFFPSITSPLIKSELSPFIFGKTPEDQNHILDIICSITTLNGSLPQGACTSPAMSNLVMARIDQRITKYCQVFGIRYTRYADDMLFSSNDFNFYEKKWFLKKIKYILSTLNLNLNYSKIKYSGNKELILNGFIISNDEIRLSRKRLSDIRLLIKFAKENHNIIEQNNVALFLQNANSLTLKHRNLVTYPFTTLFQFTQYMCGYRAFLVSLLNSNFNTPFQKDLRHLLKKIEIQISRYS